MAKYKKFKKECEREGCNNIFERSGKIDSPPRYCCAACAYAERVGVSNPKYIIPEQYHQEIRSIYSDPEKGRNHGAVAEIAERIGVPRSKITNFARENGWIPKRMNSTWSYFWSDKEIWIIERTGHYSVKSVQRRLEKYGFSRTLTAIEEKRTQLRVCRNRGGMSANDLAECMGVDVHNIINAITKGRLTAKRRPGYESDRAAWYITDANIKKYIIEWLPEINISLCDKYWLVDLLSNQAAEKYQQNTKSDLRVKPDPDEDREIGEE